MPISVAIGSDQMKKMDGDKGMYLYHIWIAFPSAKRQILYDLLLLYYINITLITISIIILYDSKLFYSIFFNSRLVWIHSCRWQD